MSLKFKKSMIDHKQIFFKNKIEVYNTKVLAICRKLKVVLIKSIKIAI